MAPSCLLLGLTGAEELPLPLLRGFSIMEIHRCCSVHPRMGSGVQDTVAWLFADFCRIGSIHRPQAYSKADAFAVVKDILCVELTLSQSPHLGAVSQGFLRVALPQCVEELLEAFHLAVCCKTFEPEQPWHMLRHHPATKWRTSRRNSSQQSSTTSLQSKACLDRVKPCDFCFFAALC